MKNLKLSVALIENTGPNTLLSVLKATLSAATLVEIAVAFVTKAGIDDLLPSILQVARQNQVRVITGLYQLFTEPRALETLLETQRQTRNNVSVRLSRDPHFHSKLYLASNRQMATVIVGSSNITKEGLRSSGELNLSLAFLTTHTAFAELRDFFEKEWLHRSVPLTQARIERYSALWKVAHIARKSLTPSQMSAVIGTKGTRETDQAETVSARQHWRDSITRGLAPKTERAIQESTDWDELGYDWYGTSRKHPYVIGDQLLIFDFTTKRLLRAEIKATTQLPVYARRDGKYFIAFKTLQWKRITRNLWKLLAPYGIDRSTARNSGYIRIPQPKADSIVRSLWPRSQ